ncbi:MAG TPA: DUF1330 domain-containing protein [Dehalococcoidia bacterium]|nr:DUF1330 domain-containing protein [Dehalococcoidia bacterium]
MSTYLIANLNIHDRDRYSRYEAGFMDIFTQSNGKILAVDENQEVLEGDYDCTRTVLIEFPSYDAAKAWYESEAYQELAAHRWAASDGSAIVIQGLEL